MPLVQFIIWTIPNSRQLKPDSHRNKKHKTSVKWRNLNPVFNEEFYFETRPNELDKQSLIITVWDKDLGSNDFLGSLVIGYASKGKTFRMFNFHLTNFLPNSTRMCFFQFPSHQVNVLNNGRIVSDCQTAFMINGITLQMTRIHIKCTHIRIHIFIIDITKFRKPTEKLFTLLLYF